MRAYSEPLKTEKPTIEKLLEIVAWFETMLDSDLEADFIKLYKDEIESEILPVLSESIKEIDKKN